MRDLRALDIRNRWRIGSKLARIEEPQTREIPSMTSGLGVLLVSFAITDLAATRLSHSQL